MISAVPKPSSHGKEDPDSPDMLLYTVAIARQRLQALAIRWLEVIEIPLRTRQTRMLSPLRESPSGIQMSELIH
jgi:hypothetical protein